MYFDDEEDENEFTNQPIEGQMSIFELPQDDSKVSDEEEFHNLPVEGQIDLLSYVNNLNNNINNVDNNENYLNTNNKENFDNDNDKEISNLNNEQPVHYNETLDTNDNVNATVNDGNYENENSYIENDDEIVESSYTLNNGYDNKFKTKNYDNSDKEFNDEKYENSNNELNLSENEKIENTKPNFKKFDDLQKNNLSLDKALQNNEEPISNEYTSKKTEKSISRSNLDLPKRSSKGGNNMDGGLLIQSIDEVLHNSMIPYSEFVLLDRALPRVEDGLKPVQRRILYTMLELGMTPDKAYRKCARIVGDCLGKYHPHGDTSVYDAMVRMAQPFNMRGILVQGHGNFGSVDGDSAAAMRYTEAKLAPLAMELLRDLDKDTVKWSFNFDDTLKEPDTLPGRFPNLLVNGAVGIAVGLATNIPPHNLNEVIDGVIALIEHPSISLKDMMKIIKGPDFPTGAIISTDELQQAYETGRGKITIRAKTHFEQLNNGKTNIVITEIPYQKNKSSLLSKIADLREDKKGVLLGIHDIKDESDRTGTRAVITIKSGYNPNDILNLLYKYSDLQSTFGINMVAIADGKPKQLGLMEILKYYLNYQIEIIVRRTKFDLNNAKERMHILEGLHIAIVNIDEVVHIIKTSPNTTEAKTRLRQRFLLSEKQAQAILDMRLARLTSLEVYKIEQEIQELKVLIEKLTAILNSKRLQLDVIKTEMLEIKRKYSMPRLTKIVKTFGEIDVDSILQANKVVEDTVVALTQSNTIKRMLPKHFDTTVKEYNSQMTENEVHYNILRTTTDKTLVAMTNKGNACKINVEDIKEVKWRDKGMTTRSACKELDVDERFLAMFEINKKDENEVIFVTKYGLLKRTPFVEYDVAKQKFSAIKLKENDEVISVIKAVKNKTLLLITKKGMALNCEIDSIPTSGRVSQGVKGINLANDDEIVFAGLVGLQGDLVLATKKGIGKRFNIGNIELSQRARKGTKIFALNDNDEIIFADVESQDTPYVIKFAGTDNFIKKTLKEFYPDKKQGKGKSLSSTKNGTKISAIYKFIIN